MALNIAWFVRNTLFVGTAIAGLATLAPVLLGSFVPSVAIALTGTFVAMPMSHIVALWAVVAALGVLHAYPVLLMNALVKHLKKNVICGVESKLEKIFESPVDIWLCQLVW